jgi:hypothetical protein
MSVPQDLTSNSQHPQVHIIEQQTRPYWENGEGSFDEWNQNQPEEYHGKYSIYELYILLFLI